MGRDLVVLGDLVADLIVPVERLPILPYQHGWAEGIAVEPGGAGNTLVAARRVNLSVATLSAVGNDMYGIELLAVLRAEGVDVSCVAETGATVLCIVLADKLGQHVYLGVKGDAAHGPVPATWHDVIRGARAFLTNGYTMLDYPGPEAIFAAIDVAREARVPVYFDFGPSVESISGEIGERAMAMADVLLLTEEEAGFLCAGKSREEMARSLLGYGPSMVVLKLGAEGCLVTTDAQTVRHPGFPVQVVDTVGAGDAFSAAFIAGCLRGGSLYNCAALANAMGALTVTQRGAGTRIPPRERLLDLLANEPAALALA